LEYNKSKAVRGEVALLEGHVVPSSSQPPKYTSSHGNTRHVSCRELTTARVVDRVEHTLLLHVLDEKLSARVPSIDGQMKPATICFSAVT
jgi:hypothetical protein